MNALYEIAGYVGIALTVIGQITVGGDYLLGQGCWLMANTLFLFKGVNQHTGRAEIVRNTLMTAITIGLIIYYML